MSLSFHRYHTHQGVILGKGVDTLMQLWLWFITSMSKFDWVSIHRYHHQHSDTEKDPHSPVVKGLAHVFFLGTLDYTKAKEVPEVISLRNKIKGNKLEYFIYEHQMLGPTMMTLFSLLTFGILWGSIISLFNFLISPLFAVGGVNALAHWWGYKNHSSKDNSRNIGFLFPLNFILCGELDHNNHHGHQRSCSFRHRWFEFDIGYFYLKVLEKFKMSKILYAYTPKTLKEEIKKHYKDIMEKDYRIKKKCEQLALEFNTSTSEIQKKIALYFEGKKVNLEGPLKEVVDEIYRTLRANYRLNLSY